MEWKRDDSLSGHRKSMQAIFHQAPWPEGPPLIHGNGWLVIRRQRGMHLLLGGRGALKIFKQGSGWPKPAISSVWATVYKSHILFIWPPHKKLTTPNKKACGQHLSVICVREPGTAEFLAHSPNFQALNSVRDLPKNIRWRSTEQDTKWCRLGSTCVHRHICMYTYPFT